MLTLFLVGCVVLCGAILFLMLIMFVIVLPFMLVAKLIQWIADYKGLD